ncbi:hypothetical protein BDV95DRAFT_316897 [Massariosphaeria phaeospora]|uniref:Uncharacterized protein n=1 Tax=Massariosphaeria phaeospora TaxID=100035 RepID=A0A7C8I9D7_9PLEO|nr:hypothetical protein BDV95DRAFT_316897 [Massariosphaeria phaeospora]
MPTTRPPTESPSECMFIPARASLRASLRHGRAHDGADAVIQVQRRWVISAILREIGDVLEDEPRAVDGGVAVLRAVERQSVQVLRGLRSANAHGWRIAVPVEVMFVSLPVQCGTYVDNRQLNPLPEPVRLRRTDDAWRSMDAGSVARTHVCSWMLKLMT